MILALQTNDRFRGEQANLEGQSGWSKEATEFGFSMTPMAKCGLMRGIVTVLSEPTTLPFQSTAPVRGIYYSLKEYYLLYGSASSINHIGE